METTTASAGSTAQHSLAAYRPELLASIERLIGWLEAHDYKGYDTFDGLNARFVRPLTLENEFLRTVLQQGVRRFPINLRPLLGVRPDYSSKGMGFLARGFMRLHEATGNARYAEIARTQLQWLIEHQSPGYSGACWGNHFDYQSRTFFLPKGVPTVVWTALIGHAFLDGFEHFQDEQYLKIAESACTHILTDLAAIPDGAGSCIVYVPGTRTQVHNANTLGASLLARTWSHTRDERALDLARRAIQYTAQHQHTNGAWYYGEKDNLQWVDNFHTAYVLDCFHHYTASTGESRFIASMELGYEYWKNLFFLEDGTPRYYDHKTLPIDIQCSSQAIDSLVLFRDRDAESLELACRVAQWTIRSMQDESGYFYYRRYSPRMVNKTPTLHWGQATMLCALAGLYQSLA
jgi:polysaccharide biosynthesis protein VpsJ